MMCLLKSIFTTLLFVTCFHHGFGEKCVNSNKDCKINEVLVTINNCSKCICDHGYYHHHGLGGCERCRVCKFPQVIVQNCTQTSNTKCGLCQRSHFYTKGKCKKCQECEYGVLKPCGKIHNTVCVPNMTTPLMLSTPSVKPTHTTQNLLFTYYQSHAVNGQDYKRSEIWYILFVVESTIVFICIILCVMCRKYSQKLYAVIDNSSLAGTSSLSSLLLLKSKNHDINILTEQERSTLIRVLPGGYADALAQLLNPNLPNNWVHLAYDFNLTLNQIANLKLEQPECTQELLLELGTKDTTTVERLWKGLKNIKRDDACTVLVNFVVNLRNDDESAIVLINGI